MKLFQLTLPNEQHTKVVAFLQDVLHLDNVTSIEARTSSIVTFRVEDEEMQAILNKLQKMGVGIQFGFCDVMSLTPGTTISKNSAFRKKKRRVGRIMERSTDVGTAVPVAEMYARIEGNATLSRDSVMMLLISSSIAGIGLAGDSSTYLVASMLLSPVMGPILGCAFGYAIRDRNLLIDGFLNLIFALAITLLLGMIIGAVFAPYAAVLKWPTGEMRARAQSLQLIFGAAVAALSGTGVALSESNANITSVVGIAIACALLPPTVNCGICLSYVIVGQYFVSDDVIGEEQKLIFYEISVGSALLVWVNVVFIYLTAIMVFKIKKVDQFQLIRRVDEENWRNLPKVQRSPGRALGGTPTVPPPLHLKGESEDEDDKGDRSSSASTLHTSSMVSGGGDSHVADGARDDAQSSQVDELPTSPLRRRQRGSLNDDNDSILQDTSADRDVQQV